MKKLLLSLAAAALFAFPSASIAQGPPQTPPPVSVLGGYVGLSVTATTGNVALPASTAAFFAITIVNSGAKDAFIAQGGSTVVATTSSIKIASGKHITIWTSGTYLAAICGGSDSTTLDIYQANGPVYFGP